MIEVTLKEVKGHFFLLDRIEEGYNIHTFFLEVFSTYP
jgi:hypothetical protein